MTWYEMIRVRTQTEPDAATWEEIRRQLARESVGVDGLTRFTILKNAFLSSDAAIVLVWSSEIRPRFRSRLSRLITMIFSQFGQVDESMWQEI